MRKTRSHHVWWFHEHIVRPQLTDCSSIPFGTRHYAWLDIVISVVFGSWSTPVLAQLERNKWQIDLLRIFFTETAQTCPSQLIWTSVMRPSLQIPRRVSSLIWTISLTEGITFMAVRFCLRCKCRNSLRLSRYWFCQDDKNCSSLCWPFFRIEKRRVMLSMGLKSRSSTSSTVLTHNAMELVTAKNELGVKTSVIPPLTYSNGHKLITTWISARI